MRAQARESVTTYRTILFSPIDRRHITQQHHNPAQRVFGREDHLLAFDARNYRAIVTPFLNAGPLRTLCRLLQLSGGSNGQYRTAIETQAFDTW
jgi:hypothetical protein